ncbi:carbohydrate-binding module family 52 protein [Lepidopterella palustris CBS 459.81]|uniref:Carbohydrate-binding module family 52 protein n=1 Tax=Lepidopterella palustris CBS 459.81 TaxID=1314670 RepID=A0A8E2DY97_9PEZI|nr:carbohydrate-binding module family 52 protein [Lepidopterella palustris CBS 459.81]
MKNIICLLAAAASAVLAEDLKNCGNAQYLPSQYNCYDGNFLCPITNGVPTLRCSDACYFASQYTCSNNQLAPVDQSMPNDLFTCGDAKYYPWQYVCWDGNFLCPMLGGYKPTLRCGDACYDPAQYVCNNGNLVQISQTCRHKWDVCWDSGTYYPCCDGLFCNGHMCSDRNPTPTPR